MCEILGRVDITVAVALITSLSTLGGGLIGSATSILTNNGQARKEKLAKRREIRRDSYMQLLNKFDELIPLLDDCWMKTPAENNREGGADRVMRARDGLRAVENATNSVQLEGPMEILDPAREMHLLLLNEFGLLLDMITENRNEDVKCCFELADDKYFKKRDSRPIAKRKFLDSGRKILNN